MIIKKELKDNIVVSINNQPRNLHSSKKELKKLAINLIKKTTPNKQILSRDNTITNKLITS
jgi:hypothetical protein